MADGDVRWVQQAVGTKEDGTRRGSGRVGRRGRTDNHRLLIGQRPYRSVEIK